MALHVDPEFLFLSFNHREIISQSQQNRGSESPADSWDVTARDAERSCHCGVLGKVLGSTEYATPSKRPKRICTESNGPFDH